VSFDLIYARPGQSADAWRAELEDALRETREAGISHLSLYQLTMEEGTPMAAAHAAGAFALPDEDAACDLFEITQELCAAAGFAAYEISNHAAPGQECRHNLVYWRGGDYVGIGPGAHGRLTVDGLTCATRQIKAPALWLRRVAAEGHGTQDCETLAAETRAEELVMMGLRLSEGLHVQRFMRLAGRPLAAVLNAAALARLTAQGFLRQADSRVAATPRGRLALNEVTRQLLLHA
jgi:oxygen-independent coproporphyrinogen-3 oxidase